MDKLRLYYEKIMKAVEWSSDYPIILFKLAAVVIGAWVSWLILRTLLSYAEKRLVRYELFRVNHRLFELARKMLFYGLILGVGAYVMELMNIVLLENAFYAFFIIFMAFPLNKFVLIVLKHLEKHVASRTESKMDDIIFSLLGKFTGVFIFSLAVIMAMDMIGVNVMPFVTGAGVAGIAIGFAAKDTLSNFIAGILLIIDRPFEVGDRIEIWSSPSDCATWGDVIDIGLRATRIKTTDNIVVIIPNNVIMTRDIINYTADSSDIRVRINIGISYEADLDTAVEIATRAASSAEWVLKEPPPKVIVRELGDFSVNLELRVWIHDARNRISTISYITENVKKAYEKADIEIPYPKQNLYIARGPEPPRKNVKIDAPGKPRAGSNSSTKPSELEKP